MAEMHMTSLAKKVQNLELCLRKQHGKEVGYSRALRYAIVSMDRFVEVEVLKSLGDLHLEKAKLRKDSAEFDKAAALYAAALLRCTDPDMEQTLAHRIGYMAKLSRQLMQGYSLQYQRLSPDYTTNNVLRVAEIFSRLDKGMGKSLQFDNIEETYTGALVTAIEDGDTYLEVEALKSLGDFYLNKGQKALDVTRFSKAAAMYNKALTRCEDPETRQTLQHRVLHMVKIWEAVKKKQSSSTKSSTRNRRPHTEHHLHPKSEFSNCLKKGESSLARADLDSAELHFAAALKMVHVRDAAAQQYQREVEPLCKLGDVYSKRGQQTGDGGDFVKAAALYNAAIARSEDRALNGNIGTAIREIERLFFKCILENNSNMSHDDTEKHKKQLKEMRDQIKLEMETIDQKLDPYVHDEDDPCVKEMEAKRAQTVKQLFEKIAHGRKEFISLLVEECIGSTGLPPCKYALIGLGSQATGLVTPYSDLEFAILVEEESEECLVYFRNLTHYLHLKVVNLGETILPALGIKSLNDFYSENPLDDWYYDSVTPRGFAFDGSMPKASKTPLGRQGTMNERPSELICNPRNMVSKLQKDVTLYLKEGYHLATILRNPCLIAGDQGLINTYMGMAVKILQADGGQMARQMAQEIVKEYEEIYNDKRPISATLIDVKKDLYRFPAVAVDSLALYSCIIPTTVWETIEEMENQQVISPSNAHHLTVLTSISAELRLRAYIANGGQKENLSALASMETVQQGQESSLQTNDKVQTNMLKPVFYLQNEKQLFRYYYTYVPLASVLSVMNEWSDGKPNLDDLPDLYFNSPTARGIMYFEICEYKLAISYFNEALEKDELSDTQTVKLLTKLGHAWHMVGNYQEAIKCSEQTLETYRSIYGQSTARPEIALSLSNLGTSWLHLGDASKAMDYYEQALEMERDIYGQSTEHPSIAASFSNLGGACSYLGDHRKAINYIEQALQMYRGIYGHSTANPDIARSLDNLAGQWHSLSEDKIAITYHEQALQMRRSIYGHSTAHPNIATSLNNLGSVWDSLGAGSKAISYHEQALQMYRSIYGQTTEHPDIANLLNNLGTVWSNMDDYRKAVSYHEQALQMKKNIYGQTKAHPHIANSLDKVGSDWKNLGDYKKAIRYHQQALQMQRDVYGHSTQHPDIATSLEHLGMVWNDLGEHRKAISYYEQALQMYRIIYGKGKAHVHIISSLKNMGSAWHYLGDYEKAIGYHEQALQMCEKIYGQGKTHLLIASILGNLGDDCNALGDYRKAISYHEQALQMRRTIYDQSKVHPRIATSLRNLGGACQKLGEYRTAIMYYEQVLQMHRSIYGQGTSHPDTASLLNNLGRAWGELCDYKKAISYYEQALKVCRAIYGTAHENIAGSLNNLGTAWSDLGNYRKAIGYHEQSLQICKSIYGQNKAHPNIVYSLNNLGGAWHKLGDDEKAISLCQEAFVLPPLRRPDGPPDGMRTGVMPTDSRILSPLVVVVPPCVMVCLPPWTPVSTPPVEEERSCRPITARIWLSDCDVSYHSPCWCVKLRMSDPHDVMPRERCDGSSDRSST
ncbi:hypothetical protein Bbelb_336120 [Branchiostoma belcheri]|nr:hypothetical protein Bbelb_336120 [Branchiostoma belcheri]